MQRLQVPVIFRPFGFWLTRAWDQCIEGLKRRCQNPAHTAVLGAYQYSGLQEDGWRDKVRRGQMNGEGAASHRA